MEELNELQELQDQIEAIAENSLEGYKQFNEGVTETDIAAKDSIIKRLTEDKYKSSLAYQIAEVQPLHSSAGAVYVAKKDANGDVEIVKENTSLKKDTASTGMTAEVMEDINRMFKGRRALTLMKNILKGASDEKENTALIAKLDAIATNSAGVAISATDGAISEQILFQISQKVAELIIQINEDTMKSLNGYAVVPQKVAAAILAMSYQTASTEKGLFVGQFGQIKYYVNPDKTATKVYVGVVDKSSIGQSSLTFAPYQYIINKYTKFSDGSIGLSVINRYDIIENPLSANGDKMVYEFTPTFA